MVHLGDQTLCRHYIHDEHTCVQDEKKPTKSVHVYYEVPSLVDKVSDSEYRRIRNSVVPENCFVRHSSFYNQFRTILNQETLDFE